MRKIAFILAGGKGERLWPLSKENYPKQFVDCFNGQSLFQETVRRLLTYFNSEDIYIISPADYTHHINNQLDFMDDCPLAVRRRIKQNVILEPLAKNTAPAIVLGLKYLEGDILGDDMIFVFPSDHSIRPVRSFIAMLKRACIGAQGDHIMLFGVRQEKMASDYGYIIAEKPKKNYTPVKRFIEKPSQRKLKNIAQGPWYCNTGIFAFKPSVFLGEMNRYAAEIMRHYESDYSTFIQHYHTIPACSIDYAIIQKTTQAAVVECRASWSDCGTWESFLAFHAKSKALQSGRSHFAVGSSGSSVLASEKLVVLVDLDDIVLIEGTDAILAIKKESLHKMRHVIDMLKKERVKELEERLTVHRAWGNYTILKQVNNYKVKEITIFPHKSISLQKHRYRSEHWNVVHGNVAVEVGAQKHLLKEKESVFVPPGVQHRITNQTRKRAVIIEVQIGSYLEEDDIVRYDH